MIIGCQVVSFSLSIVMYKYIYETNCVYSHAIQHVDDILSSYVSRGSGSIGTTSQTRH